MYFVGNHQINVLAGKAAGTKLFLINEDSSLLDFVKN
jgi:hypothetical protein